MPADDLIESPGGLLDGRRSNRISGRFALFLPKIPAAIYEVLSAFGRVEQFVFFYIFLPEAQLTACDLIESPGGLLDGMRFIRISGRFGLFLPKIPASIYEVLSAFGRVEQFVFFYIFLPEAQLRHTI